MGSSWPTGTVGEMLADDEPTGTTQLRLPFVIALVLVVGGLTLAATFVLGQRSATARLDDAGAARVQELHGLGESGLDVPIMSVVQSDDERIRLAVLVQQTLAARLSSISFALLTQADEEPVDDVPLIFDESGWTDRSQEERDDVYRRECVEWAQRVAAATTAGRAELAERHGPLLAEFAAQADELAGLCTAVPT